MQDCNECVVEEQDVQTNDDSMDEYDQLANYFDERCFVSHEKLLNDLYSDSISDQLDKRESMKLYLNYFPETNSFSSCEKHTLSHRTTSQFLPQKEVSLEPVVHHQGESESFYQSNQFNTKCQDIPQIIDRQSNTSISCPNNMLTQSIQNSNPPRQKTSLTIKNIVGKHKHSNHFIIKISDFSKQPFEQNRLAEGQNLINTCLPDTFSSHPNLKSDKNKLNSYQHQLNGQDLTGIGVQETQRPEGKSKMSFFAKKQEVSLADDQIEKKMSSQRTISQTDIINSEKCIVVRPLTSTQQVRVQRTKTKTIDFQNKIQFSDFQTEVSTAQQQNVIFFNISQLHNDQKKDKQLQKRTNNTSVDNLYDISQKQFPHKKLLSRRTLSKHLSNTKIAQTSKKIFNKANEKLIIIQTKPNPIMSQNLVIPDEFNKLNFKKITTSRLSLAKAGSSINAS